MPSLDYLFLHSTRNRQGEGNSMVCVIPTVGLCMLPDSTCRVQHIIYASTSSSDLECYYVEEGQSQCKEPSRPIEKGKRLPLPIPYKLRPLGLPRPRLHDALQANTRYQNQLAKSAVFSINFAAKIQSLPPHMHASEVFQGLENLLKKNIISSTIRELGRLKLSRRIVEIFTWAQNFPQLKPNDHILCAALYGLLDAQDPLVAFQLYKSFGKGSTRALFVLADFFVRNGKVREAMELLHKGQVEDKDVSLRFYMKLINAIDSSELGTLLPPLLSVLPSRLKLEDATAVMSACSKCGLYEEVERVYLSFRESKLKPNVVMYSVIMNARCEAGKEREGMAIFWEMEQVNCCFDLKAYEVAMKLFQRLGDDARGLRLYSKLKENGFIPSQALCDRLIELCWKTGRIERANALVKEMEKMSLCPSPKMLSLLQMQTT